MREEDMDSILMELAEAEKLEVCGEGEYESSFSENSGGILTLICC